MRWRSLYRFLKLTWHTLKAVFIYVGTIDQTSSEKQFRVKLTGIYLRNGQKDMSWGEFATSAKQYILFLI